MLTHTYNNCCSNAGGMLGSSSTVSGSLLRSWNTMMSLISRCNSMQELKATHAIFISQGLHHNNYALSKLISFCALSPSGNLHYASLLFHKTPAPNPFMYNTLIRAYSRSSQPELALHYFHLMLNNSEQKPNEHTFPHILIACANMPSLPSGTQIHSQVFKNGFCSSNSHTQTALLRLYIETSSLFDARKVFDEIPDRDVVQWNVFVKGYIQHECTSEALSVLRDMLASDLELDEYCVATGLTVCAHLGALRQGCVIHDYVKSRVGFERDVFVGTALVDMYAKCGCIGKAVEVFEGMGKRNVFTWAAMIGGFAFHGFAKEGIRCLERMVNEDRIWPDEVVLVAILTACTHAGLEEEGWFLFQNMEAQYGVVPKHEHYSCTVDLLCRAGRVEKALELIRVMPMKPLASVWGALLSACRICGNLELAELATKELLQLQQDNRSEEDGAYVQLANIYWDARRCDDARMIRKVMGDRGIKKTPGCSVVEVDGEVNKFVSGDVVHPLGVQIRVMLDLLSPHILDKSLMWKDQRS